MVLCVSLQIIYIMLSTLNETLIKGYRKLDKVLDTARKEKDMANNHNLVANINM